MIAKLENINPRAPEVWNKLQSLMAETVAMCEELFAELDCKEWIKDQQRQNFLEPLLAYEFELLTSILLGIVVPCSLIEEFPSTFEDYRCTMARLVQDKISELEPAERTDTRLIGIMELVVQNNPIRGFVPSR